ncbi:unnamed protein product [Rhizoctonia solani]|uniref:Uncharacterized protein n=1 Tax=Rhizoctonia solani TaxID=456999 RepID=A0A8H3HHB9_9AGAM|nr:unnamed protein product [Rhizoctonia solani]
MSTQRDTQNTGSGNDELRGLGIPAFLVVEHNGRKVGIGRNPNYQETIASIKKNVRELKVTPDDQVVMLTFLEEVDDYVQITEEIWTELLPRLVKIRVESGDASGSVSTLNRAADESQEVPLADAQVEEAPRTQDEGAEAVRDQEQTQEGYILEPNMYVPPHLRPSSWGSWATGWGNPYSYGFGSRLDQSSTNDNNDSQTAPGWTGEGSARLRLDAYVFPFQLSFGGGASWHLFITTTMPAQRRTKAENNLKNDQAQAYVPPAFLVAEYGDRKVTILRKPSYQETIASIKRNIRDLQTRPDDQIIVLAYVSEVGACVEVTEDVWPEILPRLMRVLVRLAHNAPSDSSDDCDGENHQSAGPSTATLVKKGSAPSHADRRPANDPVVKDNEATLFEVSYLFWEARTNPKLPSSPPTTRPSSPVEANFDPASPLLLPSHSALLPFNKVTGYIDDALLALGLHTEARTSFITYWLPDLSKHAFIALRFLPQHEYENAAPLDVSPAPQVVTRVFMLFRGVDESQVELWNEAAEMAQRDVVVWRDVVGVDIAQVRDKLLFRVVEWGGMEVN